jgi:hypothetical protein
MRCSRLPSALALATLLLVARAPRADAPQLVERVVAVVDGEPILASELVLRAAPQERALEATSLPAWRRAPIRRQLRRSVLERLVEERLIDKAAREQDIELTAAEIEQSISALASSHSLTRHELEVSIVAGGWTLAEFRRDLIPRLLERKLLQQRAARLPRWPSTAEHWEKERKRWISELVRESFVELRLSP